MVGVRLGLVRVGVRVVAKLRLGLGLVRVGVRVVAKLKLGLG